VSRSNRYLALAAGLALAPALHAQSITAGGSIEARLGYGRNPYLQPNAEGGTGQVGGTLTGWLRRRSEAAETRLTGVADINQNFEHYGRAENYLVSLAHQQTFSARLSLQGQASYQDSINPQGFETLGGTNLDLLSVGQRTRTVAADATLQWQPTARDSLYAGPTFNHTTYSRQGANDFDQYGIRGGYLRQLNAKLQLGVDVLAQQVNSRSFPDATSVQASFRLVYDLSAIWQFDGSLGAIRQHNQGFGSSTTLGFTARLCGKYPRYRACIEASRQSAPSGFGGLRTDNRAHASLDYELSTRSRLTFAGTYDISQSSSGVTFVPKQKFGEVSAGYSRTLTQRLSAGFSGRYQYRNYGRLAGVADSSVSGYAATVNVSYKFGRLE
jgi:hypothetical protein